ncbi:hypothetical protein CNE_BB2p03290 (plasmid) [Cupriavidus necator N-1]|uniref:Uncharacterized protein n=1 Tax=Cupriavidus necator (strain ATCC 43291 / DSM 13513 / CCUG 52238 / LMG 8453 / N-1) TaxID=1042878 RepID=F8GY00_CUPNN|nr:hypothetical protein CNE_BB2p03290 [Cupriavidus necator N-1]
MPIYGFVSVCSLSIILDCRGQRRRKTLFAPKPRMSPFDGRIHLRYFRFGSGSVQPLAAAKRSSRDDRRSQGADFSNRWLRRRGSAGSPPRLNAAAFRRPRGGATVSGA